VVTGVKDFIWSFVTANKGQNGIINNDGSGELSGASLQVTNHEENEEEGMYRK